MGEVFRQEREPTEEELKEYHEKVRVLTEKGKAMSGGFKTPQEMVTEFHQAFGMPVADKPGWVKDQRGELRWSLIEEEINEASDAYYLDKDLAKLAKELADVVYVVYGTAIEMGIPLDDVVAAVHQSNMSKLQPDGTVKYREDGKVLKGPDYQEPDIQAILDA